MYSGLSLFYPIIYLIKYKLLNLNFKSLHNVSPTCLHKPCLLFSVSCCFDIWGLLTLERLPLPGFLERVNNSTSSVIFKCRLTSPKPTHPTTSFIEVFHSRPLSPSPNHPRIRCQLTKSPVCPIAHWISQTSQSKSLLTYLAHSFHRYHSQGSCPHISPAPPASWSTLVLLPVVFLLHRVPCLLFLGALPDLLLFLVYGNILPGFLHLYLCSCCSSVPITRALPLPQFYTSSPRHTHLYLLYLSLVNWKLIKILSLLNEEVRFYGMSYTLPYNVQYLPIIDRAGSISYSFCNLLKHLPQFTHLSILQVTFIDDLLCVGQYREWVKKTRFPERISEKPHKLEFVRMSESTPEKEVRWKLWG